MAIAQGRGIPSIRYLGFDTVRPNMADHGSRPFGECLAFTTDRDLYPLLGRCDECVTQRTVFNQLEGTPGQAFRLAQVKITQVEFA